MPSRWVNNFRHTKKSIFLKTTIFATTFLKTSPSSSITVYSVRYELEVEIKTKMQSVSLPKYLGKAEKNSPKNSVWLQTQRLFCPKKVTKKRCVDTNTAFILYKNNPQKTLCGYKHSVYFVQKNSLKTLRGYLLSVFYVE